MTENAAQPKRIGLLIWMILTQLLALASLLPWSIATIMSLAAGGSDGLPMWMIAVLSYPIFLIVIIVGAWVSYNKRKNILAAILSGLLLAPLVWLVLAINLSWI